MPCSDGAPPVYGICKEKPITPRSAPPTLVVPWSPASPSRLSRRQDALRSTAFVARSRLQPRDAHGHLLTRRPAVGAGGGDGSRQLGLSDRTLKRAKQDLRMQSVTGFRDGVQRSYWLLAGQELPAELRPPVDPNSLEEWLAPLREKYPERTPLDEE